MIKFKIFGINIKISFLFLCLICWFFINTNYKIALIYFFSLILHEIFHILAFIICSVKIELISFKVFGINIIKKQQVQFKKEFFILIFGCFGNLLLILIFSILKLKLVVFVNLLILVFNMLPFEKLDGGEILKLVLERFLNFRVSFKICKTLIYNRILLFLFVVLFLILLFWNLIWRRERDSNPRYHC